ncbi:hypothetical protein [Maribacter polysiphoniae]|uniref:hypothetical protein n=1 Tax=Maribacter polysiphoniae TaxID=429344 RepID=UPI00235308DD|nr:hypothetical protein [Maribacter polysiphoniae]
MQAYNDILDKLNDFSKKYYTKELIKGVLLFVVMGVLFLLMVLGVEYFLWLNSTGRAILFFCFLILTGFLFYRFIFVPILYIFRIKRGITSKEASRLIGKHFPNVADRLLNLLDLAEDKNQSELLLASIEQRSKVLKPVPFTQAIDFKENLKYIKYFGVPLFLVGLIYLSGNWGSFFSTYSRVINYDLAYAPPAPFSFELITRDLNVLEDKSYTIKVTTQGDVRPDAVYIRINGKELILQEDNNEFQHTFSPPLESCDFQFFSGNVASEMYHLNVLKTPKIQNFEVRFKYPAYLYLQDEVLKSTGNAIVPEGTLATWKIIGNNTEEVHLIDKDTVWNFKNSTEGFRLSNHIYNTYEYEITSSNKNVTDYEKLGFVLTVKKDAYPKIKVEQVLDSLNPNQSYFVGESSDDYGLNRVEVVWFEKGKDQSSQSLILSKPKTNFHQFYYTFPSGLDLKENVDYQYFFRVVDNDAIHGGKMVSSNVFESRLLNQSELEKKALEDQEAIIKNMDRTLDKLEEQDKVLERINKVQKEKNILNFNDQNEIRDFLNKQEQQEQLMRKFSDQLKDNLQKSSDNNERNKLLQERLERQELDAKKNERLLEELKKIADKIDKEELSRRLEELGKKQQNGKRNLEQLLELTKRYYVTEKAAQLASDLNKLAEKQETLSEEEKELPLQQKSQEELNEGFEEVMDELEELQKDNENLKKPLSFDIDKEKEKSIKEDQQDALKEIEKQAGSGDDKASDPQKDNDIKNKQKSAAQKMKEMSEKLSASTSESGDGSTITEDAEMLRQILDNLVIFSFKQEKLFDVLEESDLEINDFSGTINKQHELRRLFEHIDDSLFSLSLRRAELSEYVNEQITEVYYNIDKSLESIAENQMYQGVSYQKYVLNASNGLADFLANILDNMQQSMMPSSGSGKGEKGFQLPDIIKGQGSLKEKLNGLGDSKGFKPNAGEKGKGEQGEDGDSGNNGIGDGNGKGDTQENNKGSGANGKGPDSGSGMSESDLKEIYEIYKEQQILRQELGKQLNDMINNDDRKLGEKLLKQMEDFENDLIENGVTNRVLNKINNIEHELLKLEDAALTKGKKSERESNSNLDTFKNPILSRPSILDNYRNDTEILNRQALPLRQNFQIKVKEYFEKDD